MAVENPVYINELNEAWPDGLDSKSQGDDHLRNLKGAIKRSFPNVKGVVTATHDQLSALAKEGTVNIAGMVQFWAGTLATIPAGWKLCNGVGTISTGLPVPDLRGRFIVGAGDRYTLNQIGGFETHGHTVTVAGHALTVDQIPSHNHGLHYQQTPTTEYRPGAGSAELQSGFPLSILTKVSTERIQMTGGGQAHTHTATVNVVDHRPPFHGLFYIIKD